MLAAFIFGFHVIVSLEWQKNLLDRHADSLASNAKALSDIYTSIVLLQKKLNFKLKGKDIFGEKIEKDFELE